MKTRTISPLNALLMLTLIIFWGSSSVVVKIALREGLTPIPIATFRFLIASALFLVALLFKKNRDRDYTLFVKKKDAPTLLLLASLESLSSSLFNARAFRWQEQP